MILILKGQILAKDEWQHGSLQSMYSKVIQYYVFAYLCVTAVIVKQKE